MMCKKKKYMQLILLYNLLSAAHPYLWRDGSTKSALKASHFVLWLYLPLGRLVKHRWSGLHKVVISLCTSCSNYHLEQKRVQCEKEVIISTVEWKYSEAIKPQPVVFSLCSDSVLINELWRNKQADLLCPCLLISFPVSPPAATLPTPRWSSKRLSWHGQVVLLLCFGKSAQRRGQILIIMMFVYILTPGHQGQTVAI